MTLKVQICNFVTTRKMMPTPRHAKYSKIKKNRICGVSLRRRPLCPFRGSDHYYSRNQVLILYKAHVFVTRKTTPATRSELLQLIFGSDSSTQIFAPSPITYHSGYLCPQLRLSGLTRSYVTSAHLNRFRQKGRRVVSSTHLHLSPGRPLGNQNK